MQSKFTFKLLFHSFYMHLCQNWLALKKLLKNCYVCFKFVISFNYQIILWQDFVLFLLPNLITYSQLQP